MIYICILGIQNIIFAEFEYNNNLNMIAKEYIILALHGQSNSQLANGKVPVAWSCSDTSYNLQYKLFVKERRD